MYVRHKTSPGRADYFQVVESRRVNGKPRQRVLVHLGQYSTVEEALKAWPREIQKLRRLGNERKAADIKSRLERLQQLFPERVGASSKTRWRISKDLKNSEGLRWVSEELATYDWSRCREISVRRWKGRVNMETGTIQRFKGVCSLVSEADVEGGNPSGHVYRIFIKLAYQFSFPEVVRSGAELHNENEVLVWVLAHEAAHYLFFTDQIPGENTEEECDAYADERLREYRASYPTRQP